MKHRILFAMTVLAWLTLVLPVPAEETSADSSPEAEPTEARSDAPRETSKNDGKRGDEEAEKERQKNAKIGMVFVAGIGFLGVFLIAFILIYGRRLRRQLKHKRTPTQARDELWYLKSKPERPEREDADA